MLFVDDKLLIRMVRRAVLPMNFEERAAVLMLAKVGIVGIGGCATINNHGGLCCSDLDAIWSGDPVSMSVCRLSGHPRSRCYPSSWA